MAGLNDLNPFKGPARPSLYRPNQRHGLTFWLAVILGALLGLALSADAAVLQGLY